MFWKDDGSLEYAKAVGIHIDGLEAPVFPERTVDGPFGASASSRLTLLAFGQSNAANSGDGLYAASKAACVFNAFDMKFYAAIDPLPGASNDGAAVWTRLADKLRMPASTRRSSSSPSRSRAAF